METKTVIFEKPFKVGIISEKLGQLRENEVLVKTLVTLISTGTEMTAYTGDFPSNSEWSKYVRYPFKPGYSNIGEVVEVGDSVKGFRVGDIVASLAPHTQYYIAREDRLVKVPQGIDVREATFHTIACGVMNSVRLSGVKLGESVVVIGAGLLGQFATLFSKLSGGFPVITVDLSDFRLRKALQSGANYIINPERENVFEKVLEYTEARRADVVFEVTGNPKVIEWAIKLVREMGRFIVLSSPRGPSTIDFHDEVNRPSRIIIGTHFTSQPKVETLQNPWTRKRNAELFFKMLKHGVVKVSHLITHVFHWEEVKEAYKLLLDKRLETLGVILDFRE
ncbi:MAG TPA: hypothetical protein ENF87_02145 [Thermoproteales archaeon]|nr:hypothetical protein [Thermoproteales archaeon]